MAKKLTNTSKWKSERWFRLLPPYYKLAWEYIHGICEIDGTWEINCLDLLDDTKIPGPFDLMDFIQKCNIDFDQMTGEVIENHRVLRVEQKFLWLTGYIKLQQEGNDLQTVNPMGNYARGALMKLAAKGILGQAIVRGFIPLAYPIQTLTLPIINPMTTVLYIDINKDIDIGIIRTMYSREPGDKKGGMGGRKGEISIPPAGDGIGGDVPNLLVGDAMPTMTQADFVAFEEQLAGDRKFIEPLMMGLRIKSEKDLGLWIKSFSAHIVAENHTRKDYNEYRKHFKRWINKQGEKVAEGPPKALNIKNGTANTTAGAKGAPLATSDDIKKYQKQPN